ncbi:putative oxidoreductase [Alkalibacterium sp. AK22]|uniref:Gfo/Idh/MocA family protein n=1 Tax=Alkalibacterium sp. AK22 TaxID=1229520 RepID=UPI000452AC61|nr:Gfo/Idh/MocA family oxidoreductase [Alkalibacterium sp. AK22]EXJ23636.1 putative oxidoreductase [Alkalibacterium sp. AK22]
MMKIGVIGLGTIAQKAYLPVYTREFPEHEWHFCTRDADKLRMLGKTYGLPKCRLHREWKALSEIVEAVFIHSPTATHYEIVSYFLKRNIPVFVDKPLTEYIRQTQALLQLAEAQQVLLMTGFNRRFAPAISELANVEGKNRLTVQKNQVNATDFPVRNRVYDMMIHPIDTAVYLMGEKSVRLVDSKVEGADGDFRQAWVLLESPEMTAMVSINNQSGAKRETVELQSTSGTYTVNNLTEVSIFKGTARTDQSAGDWTQTLEKRGFIPMVGHFLKAAEEGGETPVSNTSTRLSHEICEGVCLRHEERVK